MLYVFREKELPCLNVATKGKTDSSATVSPGCCGLVSDIGDEVTALGGDYREDCVISTAPVPGVLHGHDGAHLHLFFPGCTEKA